MSFSNNCCELSSEYTSSLKNKIKNHINIEKDVLKDNTLLEYCFYMPTLSHTWSERKLSPCQLPLKSLSFHSFENGQCKQTHLLIMNRCCQHHHLHTWTPFKILSSQLLVITGITSAISNRVDFFFCNKWNVLIQALCDTHHAKSQSVYMKESCPACQGYPTYQGNTTCLIPQFI